MKQFAALAFVAIAAQAAAAQTGVIDPPRPLSEPQPAYRGSSGAQYQYDLSRPNDQVRYGIDPGAQIRDSISVDPRRDLDRSLGQQGGGIRR